MRGGADEWTVRSLDVEPRERRTELPRMPLHPHMRHTFEDEVLAIGDVTYVRFNIYPDGGVGRLRLFGRPRRSET